MITARSKTSKINKTKSQQRVRNVRNNNMNNFGKNRFQHNSSCMLEDNNTSILLALQAQR